MDASLDIVRKKLTQQRHKLWLPPFTPKDDNDQNAANQAMHSLAVEFAESLEMAVELVSSDLKKLQSHALAKVEARARVTFEGRLLGDGRSIIVSFPQTDLGSKVRKTIEQTLQVPRVEIICSGRAIQDNRSLQQQSILPDVKRSSSRHLKVLLLASGHSCEGHPDDEAAAVVVEEERLRLAVVVVQIREAAARLTRDGFGDLELTDAKTGALVPVPPLARTALITAILLHVKGRDLLRDDHGDTTEAGAVASLPFLSESDAAFAQCRSLGAGVLVDKIDNFCQLQLDLVWAYVRLGNLDHLSDAERRLTISGERLMARTDPSFLEKLHNAALQNRTLPPAAVPLARFFLLRGISAQCRLQQSREDTDGSMGAKLGPVDEAGALEAAQKDLERAALFLKSLRVKDSSVLGLMELGATRVQATATLRKAEGHPDIAQNFWLDAQRQRREQKRSRHEQSKLGQTVDGSFIDLEKRKTLTDLYGVTHDLAVASLRQTNNDMNAALDWIQKNGNNNSNNQGTNTENTETVMVDVDEVALVTLVSMGVSQSDAKAALQSCGNDVNEALLLVTSSPHAEEEAPPPDAEEDAPMITKASENMCAEKEHGTEIGDEERLQMERRRKEEEATYNEARNLIEAELGSALRRRDLEDEVAGSSLHHEVFILSQFGYSS